MRWLCEKHFVECEEIEYVMSFPEKKILGLPDFAGVLGKAVVLKSAA